MSSSDGSQSASGQQDHLNGHSGLILAVFCVVSALVIWPVHIPLPAPAQRWLLKAAVKCRVIGAEESAKLSARRLHIHLSLTTAPVIAVILLLATTTIHGSTIKLGIKGDANVKPYDVLVLFISLAYISIALDGTGALEATAFYVSQRGGSSGRLLFTYLYLFFLGTACIVGNDPLILSGTPFLAYLAHHTGIDPTAWVFAEFMAANTASAVLVSSNPTNVLITGSFDLNYLTDFTKWTVLPSLIPAALNYPILLLMFWKRIPKTLVPLTEDPWSKLRDRRGALFLSILMLVTVAVLVGTSFVPGHGAEVWMVTMPAGVTAFLYNVVSDWLHPEIGAEIMRQLSHDDAAEMRRPSMSRSVSRVSQQLQRTQSPSQQQQMQNLPVSSRTDPEAPVRVNSNIMNGAASLPLRSTDPEKAEFSHSQSQSRSPTIPAEETDDDKIIPSPSIPAASHDNEKSPSQPLPTPLDEKPSPETNHVQGPTPSAKATLTSLLHALSRKFPATANTLTRLPIPLLPFAMAEFILVRGLSQRGWMRVFASGFARACSHSPAIAAFFFGSISAAFLCPLAGTNIGATIILVEILRDPQFQAGISSGTGAAGDMQSKRVMDAAIYAVAMGSNIGAFGYTFAGSLAGLLWRGLLADKGVTISQWTFAKVNAIPLIMQITVASAIVVGEVYWFV